VNAEGAVKDDVPPTMPFPIRLCPGLHPRTGRLRTRRAPLRDERGFTLIEMLVGLTLTLVVVTGAAVALQATTRTQNRDQAYQEELQSAQVGVARLIHDLREATSFSLTPGAGPTAVAPGVIEFQLPQGGQTWNVEYNCNAPDTLGPPYTRCARTQALAPNLPPAAGATPGPQDIQHIWNNPSNTNDLAAGYDYGAFCTTNGSAQSGSVFFVQNPNTANPDSNPPACDQTYELIVAQSPDYVQVKVEVPAGGDLSSSALRHLVVIQDGAYLQNIDQGA